MGCDIHLEVEQRDAEGNWHLVRHLDRPCNAPYCENGIVNGESPDKAARGDKCYRCKGEGHYPRRAYSYRDYVIFSMLANVRNGIPGIDGYEYLTDDRGIPDDISQELQGALDRLEAMTDEDWDTEDFDDPESPSHYELGDHSFTWLTYQELLNPEFWAKVTRVPCWVDPWNYDLFRRRGRPEFWLGSADGKDRECVSPEFMDHIIDSGDLEWTGPEPADDGWSMRPYTTSFDRIEEERESSEKTRVVADTQYFTRVVWEISYGEQARYFLDQIAEFVECMGSPSPCEVRLVMGFDN